MDSTNWLLVCLVQPLPVRPQALSGIAPGEPRRTGHDLKKNKNKQESLIRAVRMLICQREPISVEIRDVDDINEIKTSYNQFIL